MMNSKWMGVLGFIAVLGGTYPISFIIDRQRPPCHFILVVCRELGLMVPSASRESKSRACLTPAIRDGRLGDHVFDPGQLQKCHEAREASRGLK